MLKKGIERFKTFYVHRDFQAALAFERKGTRHKFNAGCLIVTSKVLGTPLKYDVSLPIAAEVTVYIEAAKNRF
jgi:hypothetical protein